jgi:hypothetical protein
MVKKFVIGAFLLCLVGLNASVCWCAWEVQKLRLETGYLRVRVDEMPSVYVKGVDSVKVTGSPMGYPVKVQTE